MHNSFILQHYVCYTTIPNMFRAARCSSSGGPIVSPQPLVSSPSVNSRIQYAGGERIAVRSPPSSCIRLFTEGDDARGCGDIICPPEDEQRAARNMLRIVVQHTYCWRIKELCIKLVICKSLYNGSFADHFPSSTRPLPVCEQKGKTKGAFSLSLVVMLPRWQSSLWDGRGELSKGTSWRKPARQGICLLQRQFPFKFPPILRSLIVLPLDAMQSSKTQYKINDK